MRVVLIVDEGAIKGLTVVDADDLVPFQFIQGPGAEIEIIEKSGAKSFQLIVSLGASANDYGIAWWADLSFVIDAPDGDFIIFARSQWLKVHVVIRGGDGLHELFLRVPELDVKPAERARRLRCRRVKSAHVISKSRSRPVVHFFEHSRSVVSAIAVGKDFHAFGQNQASALVVWKNPNGARDFWDLWVCACRGIEQKRREAGTLTCHDGGAA